MSVSAEDIVTVEQQKIFQEFLYATGTLETTKILIDEVMQKYVEELQMSKMPAEQISIRLQQAREAIKTSSRTEYMSHVRPVYTKFLTYDEMKAITQFYTTETGKKLLQVSPYMSQEAFQANVDWMETLPNVIQRGVTGR